jgi:hypothetical protein
MQPADNEATRISFATLQEGADNTFDTLMSGARLRPVRFGSRRCTERERHFRSFVDETIAGRWAIGQNRKYLWGCHFYWFCDCSAMKEALDYTGDIYIICCIAPNHLAYHFTLSTAQPG